jgi:hypothetical protein
VEAAAGLLGDEEALVVGGHTRGPFAHGTHANDFFTAYRSNADGQATLKPTIVTLISVFKPASNRALSGHTA